MKASLLWAAVLLLLLLSSPLAARADGTIWTTGYVERGYMASGAWTYQGAAACPYWMAFGTRLVLDGVGTLTCQDRYSRLLSDRIDVWTATTREAYQMTGMRLWWWAEQ